MRAGIALGSNLGDRGASLRAARTFLLSLHEAAAPALVSPLYETAPVDCPPGSPPFLNAVVEIALSLPPADLLARCTAFERSLGRPVLREKNSPRPVDLDVLYAGDLRIESPSLTLPHPRLAMRLFVLQPLADIRPDLVLPGRTGTVAQLLAAMPPDNAPRLFAAAW